MEIAAILMDKGIIIGVDHEVSGRRGLPFTLFKIQSGVGLAARPSKGSR